MRKVIKRVSALVLAAMMFLSLSAALFADGTNDQILDFSSLNRTPAGGYGSIVADGDRLAFNLSGDLTQARFFGVSYDLSSGIPDESDSVAMSEDLYKNGINLLVIDNVYAALGTPDGDVDAESVSAFDVFVHELYRKGIYVYVKMFTPESLGVSGTDMFLSTEITNLTQRFLRRFFSHFNLNGYTYAQDPTVIAVQYFSGACAIWQTYADFIEYGDILQAKFNSWLATKHGTMNSMIESWTSRYLETGLTEGEDFTEGSVLIDRHFIPENEIFNWTDKMSFGRQSDYKQFLIDMEKSSYTSLEKYIRLQNYNGIIVYSDTSYGPASTELAGLGDAATKTLTYNDSMNLTDAFAQLTSGVISGKPFFASWDTSTEISNESELFLKLTMYASFQGWDAFILGNYSYNDTAEYNVKSESNLWSLCGLFASIYRNGYISEANSKIDIVYTEADILCESGNYGLLSSYAAYFSKVGNVFLSGTDVYSGDADVAISSGNTSSGDYTEAKSAIIHSAVSYTNQYAQNADKSVWYNTQVEKKVMGQYTIDGVDVRIGSKRAIAVDAPITTMNGLSEILKYLPSYNGKAITDGVAYSDTNQLAYNLSDGGITLVGRKAIIAFGDLSKSIDLSLFNITASGDDTNVVIYTPGNSNVSNATQYIAFVEAGGEGKIKITRKNYTCVVYGINADGTKGNELNVDEVEETGELTVNISPEYRLYQFVLVEKPVSIGISPPEVPVRPNLVLLISLPALAFLAIAVTIVIINANKRAKVEEELRVSSLAAILKKKAEHKRKLSHFDDEED